MFCLSGLFEQKSFGAIQCWKNKTTRNLLWSAPSWAPWGVSDFHCLFLLPHASVPLPLMSGLYKTWWLCPCSDGPQSTVRQKGIQRGTCLLVCFCHQLRKTCSSWLVMTVTHRFIKLLACLSGINFAWEGDSGHSGVQGMDDAVIYCAHGFQDLLMKINEWMRKSATSVQ